MVQLDSAHDDTFRDKATWMHCGVPTWAWEFPELHLLKNDVAPSPEAGGPRYRELFRTACSLRCLEYLWAGSEEDYTAFVRGQPSRRTTLTKERFRSLHHWVKNILVDDSGLMGMRYLMLVHDAGKCAAVVKMTQDAGLDWTDHDDLLRCVMKTPRLQTALLPNLGVLGEGKSVLVRDVLGLECNLGQVMQGEAPAGVLLGWDGVGSHVRDWYLVHLLLDLAGVKASDGRVGATALTLPVVDEFTDLAEAMGSGETAAGMDRYGCYLSLRATVLGLSERVADADLVAVTRLALMLQVMDATGAAPDCGSWEGADPESPAVLRRELGRDGVSVHAFRPYYGPAFMRVTAQKAGIRAAMDGLAARLGRARAAMGEPEPGITNLDFRQEALGVRS